MRWRRYTRDGRAPRCDMRHNPSIDGAGGGGGGGTTAMSGVLRGKAARGGGGALAPRRLISRTRCCPHGGEQGGKCDEGTGVSKHPAAEALLGAAMSSMAETIGNMVAWRRAEWENHRRRRGGGHGAVSGGTWLDNPPRRPCPYPTCRGRAALRTSTAATPPCSAAQGGRWGSTAWHTPCARAGPSTGRCTRSGSTFCPSWRPSRQAAAVVAALRARTAWEIRDHTPAGTPCAPSP